MYHVSGLFVVIRTDLAMMGQPWIACAKHIGGFREPVRNTACHSFRVGLTIHH